MNKRIKELAEQCGWLFNGDETGNLQPDPEKFANLIIKEHLNLIQQEWYDINNTPINPEGERPRDVGIRVGKKGEIITLITKIRNHFGVNND